MTDDVILDGISGWGQKITDGSAFWTILDKCAQILGGEQFVGRHAWNDDLTDVMMRPRARKRGAIAYSYGCADHEKWQSRYAYTTPFDFLVRIVGVNRVADGQAWEKCWFDDPAKVKRSVTFNTVYRGCKDKDGRLLPIVIPECCPCRNPDALHVNYDCFWAGVDHSNILELPIVQETIFALVHELKT